MIDLNAEPIKAVIIHPVTGGGSAIFSDYDLEEAVRLAEALDAHVVEAHVVPVREIRAGEYFGKGKAAEIGDMVSAHEAKLVIINTSLAPIQQRNLEELWNAKVIDRTGMILEIFALRAATKEGRLQVELARQSYERSRLVRTWTHLERQRGGQGFLAGPGETQIESDRRMLDQKIGKIRKAIDQVRRTRELQRTKRQRAPERVVALVGYTNTGKSTLFNRLTEGGVLEKDMLFATLDTTHRILPLPSGRSAVMSDTVGFISDLPTHLVTAFRATLEEVKEADIILHIRDVSDPMSERRKKDVLDILDSLDAGPNHHQPILEVMNKADLLSPEDFIVAQERAAASRENENATSSFLISSIKRQGLTELMEGLEAELGADDEVVDMLIPPSEYAVRAWLHEHGDVISEETTDKGEAKMSVRLPAIEAGIVRSRHWNLLAH
ncbi:MAG: GTPase HflX [Robiginitomaculum sp.]